MKKFLSVLSVFCLTLFAGAFLCACGEKSNYTISVSTSGENSHIEVVLQKDGETLTQEESGAYNVEKSSNIKVLINATQHGVDMSELSVKVNNENKQVVVNKEYSPLISSSTLNYGYFLISNLNKDLDIVVSGEKIISSTFTFEVDDIEDPEVITKLKMTSICLEYGEMTEEGENPTPEYVNFYDYLTSGEDLSFEREYDESGEMFNSYKTFRLKFEGITPFNLEEGYPFEIKAADGQPEQIGSMNYMDGYYVVDLGDIGMSSAYTILVNYKTLNYQRYNISVPQNNLTYSIEVPSEIISYDQEEIITLTKNLDNDKADFTNMRVYINSLELEKVEGGEKENTIQYLIPKGITPASTGGVNVYRISVDGIEYLVPVYKLYANSVEPVYENQFIMPEIWAVDDEGQKIGVVSVGSDGEQMTLEGQRNAIIWSYNYDEENQAYYSLYDLYDYSIYANSDLVLNIKETLDGATQDLNVELENGYVFKAFYNQESKKFDSFQLEFYCTEDTMFEFRDFVMFSKNINISYSFDDTRIDNVEYAVLKSEDTSTAVWAQLDGEGRTLAVNGGDVVAFRLSSTRDVIGEHEFKIENSKICNSWYNGESYELNGSQYTILKFIVSEIQYDGSMDFKLVPAGAVL